MTIPLAAAAALLAFSAAAHDVRFYDFDQLQRKVLSLQEEVKRLSQAVAGGESIMRFDDMENEISRLTGELEQLGYRISTLETQMGRKMEDLEYRVIELEGGDGGSLYETTTDQGLQRQNAEAAETPPAAGAAGQAPAAAADQTRTAAAPADGLTDAQRGAVGALGTLRVAGEGTAGGTEERAVYEAGMAAFRANRMDVARSSLEGFVRDYPESGLAGSAYYWLGETYVALGDDQTAARRYLDSATLHPDAPKAPESLLALAKTLGRLGQTKVSCATLREVGKRYPDATDVARRADMAARDAGCR